jgi:CO/xanthine dehydrogenase Mo-binding subunit
MTGLIPEKQFSRKSFVKGGGALIVGFSLLGSTAGKAAAATGNTPFAQRTPADFLPSVTQVDTWLAITPQNTAIITHGETELGHGTPTGILSLMAEELNMDFSQMIYAHPESWLNATGGGGGSGGISGRSTNARAAAAMAKTILLGMASTKLGVPVANLSVKSGVITGGGQTVKYSDLIGGKTFNYDMVNAPGGQSSATPGQGYAKPVAQYAVVGKSFPRIDIPAKVNGTYTYIQNVRIPGMVHARSVRPRGAGADTSVNNQPISVDPTSIAHIPGAQVVQINNFVSVVAPKEYDAIQAAAQLKVVWKSDPKFSGSGNYWSWLRTSADANQVSPARWTADTGNVPQALAAAAVKVSATYKYPYNNFVPIGPHCAVADIGATSGVIYCQGQSINGIPGGISTLLSKLPKPVNIPANQIRVIWYEGASSFGGGQQGEASEMAAIISATIGKPVRMQWMRWDQTGWDSYGPSQMYDVTMGTDATGKIVVADWTSYGQGGGNIDVTQELLGTTTWPATPASGGPNPSDSGVYGATGYTTPYTYQRRVLAKSQPLYNGSLKTSALRAPNAPQSYFASEQIVDELAYTLKMDPVAFRRMNIDPTVTLGQRWLSVLDAATIAAGWKPKVAASNLSSGNVVTGRGFGFGTFASSQVGLVADIQVTKSSGKILVKHVWVAQNNGITVNPQNVGNQMSGALIQGLSRAMVEQATFNKERVTSLDWVTYPILRFKDAPSVTLINVHPGTYQTVIPGDMTLDVSQGNTNAFNNGWTLSGSGEPPTTAISSAVANAFFDATGVRIRQAPMVPANIRGVLKNAGVIK